MESKCSDIICFTSSYPYGDKETYFENELRYLANKFRTVYIQPTYNPYGPAVKRKLPDNAIVIDKPLVPANKSVRLMQGILNFSPFTIFFKDFFKNRAYRSTYSFLEWFNAFLIFRISCKRLKNLLREFDHRVVLYSYWASAYVFPTKLCKPYKKVIRMHGGDFYLNRHNGYLPLRNYIYNSADVLFPISQDISKTLEKKYKVNKDKISLNYLGVYNTSTSCALRSSDHITIVSCSNLFDYKRVNLIAETLLHWTNSRTIIWHHFGDGPEFNSVVSTTKKIRGNVIVNMHGAVSQDTLFDFYKNNYVTWFLNLSIYEGVPVSIMEAFSFGIPTIATDVGATSEIVNQANGYLLPKDFDKHELLKILQENDRLNNYQEKRINAFYTWDEKFNADINYSKAIKRIIEVGYANSHQE